MNQKGLSLLVGFVILTTAFFAVVSVLPVNVRAKTLYVGGTGLGNHTTIQGAIDNASDGDTVYVYNGTYVEEILVNKSISLIGEDKNTTVIRGTGWWLVVHVTADSVNITGFNITNGGWNDPGIYLTDVQECNISDNIISNNDNGITSYLLRNSTITNNVLYSNVNDGISLYWAENNTIADNVILNSSGYGIFIDESSNITIANNSISPNNEYGVYVMASFNVTLSNNDITSNVLGVGLNGGVGVTMTKTTMNGGGIFVISSSLVGWNTHSIDTSNTVNGKPVYYFKDTSGGTPPLDAGQVILANSSGMLVENYDFSNIHSGILLGFSSYNVIANITADSGVYGTYLTESHNNIITNNSFSAHETSGILLARSDHNLLTNNEVSDNDVGIWIVDSDENILDNNTCHSNERTGIEIFANSDNNTVTNNTATSNYYGISIEGGRFNSIVDNRALMNGYNGINVRSFELNIVTNNNASLNDVTGIGVYYSRNNTISDNDAFSNGMYGISLINADNNSIVNNRVGLNEKKGVSLESSDYNVLSDNNVSHNLGTGFWIFESDWNFIDGNSIFTNDFQGIYLTESHNNTIIRQEIFSNSYNGIVLHHSQENAIIDSTISDTNYYGIFLFEFCHKTRIINNSFSGINIQSSKEVTMSRNLLAGYGVVLSGESVEFWNTHSIDESNLVNSRPVYYWKDTVGGTIPLDAGQVILANCTDLVVEDQNVVNGSISIQISFSTGITLDNVSTSLGWGGIFFYFVNHSSILNSEVTDTRFGIRLRYSNHNIVNGSLVWNTEEGILLRDGEGNFISNNTATLNSRVGIALHSAFDSVVAGNTASFNQYHGFFIHASSGNIITANNASSNSIDGFRLSGSASNKIINNNISLNDEHGLHIQTSSNNDIFHNNFIGNANQSLDYNSHWGSSWDNGYPHGGNYWSDYSGVDLLSGSDQDQPGSDGIGDTPYDVPAWPGNPYKDRYPLMNPINPTPVYLPSAPKNFKVIAGDESATLTWEYPAFDGDSPILGYKIWRLHGGGGYLHAEVGSVLNFTDTGLTNGEEYIYWMHAFNEVGESPSTEWMSAIPTSPPPNQSPVCLIVHPTSGAELSGLVIVNGTASDPDGTIHKIEIRIDDGVWEEANGSSSWTYEWNTSVEINGNHRIYARAFDGENFSTVVYVSVIVNNYVPPPEKPKDDSAWIVAVAAVVVMAIVLSTLYLLFRIKKKRELDEGVEIEEEQSE